MEYRIDEKGWILRNGQELYCPWCREDRPCGDWCPHFPVPSRVPTKHNGKEFFVLLWTCGMGRRTLVSEDDFTCERDYDEE